MILLDNIKKIIATYFDEELIINPDVIINSPKIKQVIFDRTNGKMDWNDKNAMFMELKNRYHNQFIIDSQVHFFYNDRCMQIVVHEKMDDNIRGINKFIVRISIFNYFQVTRRNETFFKQPTNKILSNVSSELYVEQGEDKFCDDIFEMLKKYYPALIWLPSALLKKKIYELDIFPHIINKSANVSDLLFFFNDSVER